MAMIPNREHLYIAGSDDLHSLKGMLKLAVEDLGKPRPISGIALRLDDDEWVPWLPENGHPLYWEFRKLQTQSFGRAYAEQKELLDKLYRRTGEDVFVASFSGMGREGTDEIVSYCVWSKGVLALLPRTDRVAFMRQDTDPVIAAWDGVVKVVGDMMEPMGMYPERYRVSEFPTEGQLAAMGCKKPKP